MKKSLQIISTFLVLFLLCLIDGKNEVSISNSYPSEEKSHVNLVRINDNSATVCFDNRVNTISHTTTHSVCKIIKLYFNGFYPNESQIEHFLKQTISRNSIFSENGCIHFSPTDIIFPFHYFW